MPYCYRCGLELVEKETGGRMRLACPSSACGFVDWGNPTPVVAAIVEIDGKVVLTRAKGWPEKWRGLVAGFLEQGETPEEAILREVQEELGLEATVERFVGHYAFPQMNQLIMAFHVSAQGEIRLGDELEAAEALRPEDVRPWPIGTGPALKDWLASRSNGSA